MKLHILLCTNDTEDRNTLIKTLHPEGYEITLCSSLPEMLTFAYSDTPTCILLNPDFEKDAIAYALQFSNDPATNKNVILFLLPARPDYPPFLYQFQTGCTGVLLRPYARGEVEAIVKAVFAAITKS